MSEEYSFQKVKATMNKFEFIGGITGTAASAVGTSLQTSEVLQIISLIITILGGTLTLIVIPIYNWYKNAKKDGKIDKEEIDEAVHIIQNGTDSIKEVIDSNKKEEK